MKPAPIFITLLVSLARGQSPAVLAAPETGIIEGKVLSTSGVPLPKTALHLRSTNAGGTNYTVSTDAQGRYVFEAIPTGRYRLSADRGGYLPQYYGDRSVLQCCGRDIALPPGGHLEGLAVTLTPQAAISGRVLDEDGDPVSGAIVSASRIGYLRGQKTAAVRGTTLSNPDGTFTVWNLKPGRYYISASQTVNPRADEQPAGKTPALSPLTTYFPSVTEEFLAAAIVVGAGVEVRGIDVRMVPGKKYGIRGKVTGLPERGGFPGLNLLLSPKNGVGQTRTPSALGQDGTFIFAEVNPGEYILRAQTALGGPVPLQAYLEIGVTDQDLEVEVPLTPAAEITGTVKIFHNDALAVMMPQPVVLLNNPAFTLSAESSDASGSFRIRGIAATRYRVSVLALPPGVLVKAIRFEGQEITHEFLDLTSGAGGTLEIVLSPTAPELTGIVHNEDGAAIPDATVTVWKTGGSPGGLFDPPSEVRSDASGQFQFQNLPFGEYLMGAWEDLEPGLAQAPEFRSAFESSATKVKLEEGGHLNVDLKVFGQSSVASALARLP